MRESVASIMSILALIGLALIIGLIMRYFNALNRDKESNTDFMVNTLGDGCGMIMDITTIGGFILGLFFLIFD